MKRARLTISIPQAMNQYVQDRVDGATYASVSEYFRELIRNDQRIVQRARAEAAIRRQPLASAARRPVDPFAGRRY